MKLYLASYQVGNHGRDLASLVTGGKRIAVIRNALDFSDDQQRLKDGREREFCALRELGLSPEEIDLKAFFDSPDDLPQVIAKFDGLWVVGGNTFILRRAMIYSGLDGILLERTKDEDFVYAGYSAGVCVLAPTLRGIHLVDDPLLIPQRYSKEIIWEGLGFLPFCVAPHYRSDHPESEMIERSVEFFVDNKVPFIALRDGEVYIGALKEQPNDALQRT